MTRFAAVAATVAAAAYAALVSQAVVTKYGLKILYAWHPLAASCFLVFAFLGVVTAQRASASGNRKAALDQHAYWQTAAALCALSTNAIIYVNKEQRGRPHLVSWHGKLGALTATLWLLTQAAWLLPKLLKGAQLRQAYKFHKIGGYGNIGLLIATHVAALMGGYQGFAYGTPQWYVLAALLAAMGLSVLIGSRPFLKQLLTSTPAKRA